MLVADSRSEYSKIFRTDNGRANKSKKVVATNSEINSVRKLDFHLIFELRAHALPFTNVRTIRKSEDIHGDGFNTPKNSREKLFKDTQKVTGILRNQSLDLGL